MLPRQSILIPSSSPPITFQIFFCWVGLLGMPALTHLLAYTSHTQVRCKYESARAHAEESTGKSASAGTLAFCMDLDMTSDTTNLYAQIHFSGCSASPHPLPLQDALTLLQRLSMHVHRPVREAAVRALDMSFKRYSCLLPACIPTALCALAKLPLPDQPLQKTPTSPSLASILPAIEQAMLDSAATSSHPAQLSAAGNTMQAPLHDFKFALSKQRDSCSAFENAAEPSRCMLGQCTNVDEGAFIAFLLDLSSITTTFHMALCVIVIANELMTLHQLSRCSRATITAGVCNACRGFTSIDVLMTRAHFVNAMAMQMRSVTWHTSHKPTWGRCSVQ